MQYVTTNYLAFLFQTKKTLTTELMKRVKIHNQNPAFMDSIQLAVRLTQYLERELTQEIKK